MNAYAGIGSRETPEAVLRLMRGIGRGLANRGWVLRSGAADGADAAFEQGHLAAGGIDYQEPEIFLPWWGFNGHRSRLCYPTTDAINMARQYHPAWGACSEGAKKLHARNMHQIMGIELDQPVAMVICWTANGTRKGGTGQALRVASHNQIPIFDLGREDHDQGYERTITAINDFIT